MAQTDFTIADVLAWARTKPADERYTYSSSRTCALCQFLNETGRTKCASVGAFGYGEFGQEDRPLAPEIDRAVMGAGEFGDFGRCTFGALVRRLEKLCPEAPVPPSEWTRLDAYMADIELASA